MWGTGLRVAVFALFFSVYGQAQTPPPTPPPLLPYPPGLHLFPIVVQGRPHDLKVTLATEENGKPFLYCEGRCGAWAYPGEYWIAVRSTPHTAAGKRAIRLSRPSTIEVGAREKDAQATTTTVGLVFIGAGLGLFAASAYMAAQDDDDDYDDDDNDIAGVSALTFGLSALSGVTGLVLLMVGGTRDTTVPDVTIED